MPIRPPAESGARLSQRSAAWAGKRSSSSGTGRALFYLDPPYWGTEHYCGRGFFERSDFERLSAALQRLQGRFILSLNVVPEVRELFAWVAIETVELSYQAGGAGQTKRVREVVICGPT